MSPPPCFRAPSRADPASQRSVRLTSANETRDVAIHGDVEDGYGAVADEFRRNFRDRHDLGAGCAVYVDGRQVVDLWAGVADRRSGKPFEHDTATVIFSCTKGIMAICAYLLVQD